MNTTVLIIIGTQDNFLAGSSRGFMVVVENSCSFSLRKFSVRITTTVFPLAPFVNLCAGASVSVFD